MTRTAAGSPGSVLAPSVHARAVITWFAIFSLVTIGSFAIAPFATDWNPVVRAFILSAFVVPLAVYVVVPRLLHLYGRLRFAKRARHS